MANPMIGKSSSQSSRPKEPKKVKITPLATRRFVAWTVEITLFIASGLVPYSLGVYVNSRSEIQRVPLNPVLVVTEKAIARPLALPISYGIRNVAWPTNILWTLALLLPTSLCGWQLYLLAKTGSTIPKRWFGVRVVNIAGETPGLSAVIVREGLGRWTIPVSAAYLLWRYSFVFPNLALFTSLAMLMILAESKGWPNQKHRRSFHDQLAGTYTIDATSTVIPAEEHSTATENNADSAANQQSTPPSSPRNNPTISLFLVGLTSMIAVLSTLIGTQIYIQTQENQRRSEQTNSQKFLELIRSLNPNNGVTNEDRQRVILALGSVDDKQSIKLLIDLLVKETDPKTLDTIQQALTNAGFKAIPELNRMNQFLAGELASMGKSANGEIRQNQLILTQQVINKILAYNGKINKIDLSNAQLGSQASGKKPLFNLVLNNLDLSGIVLKSANLNQANFQGSRFRSVGEDGRGDTYDDAIADLNNTQLKQANLSNTNLSRVPMSRSDLSGANLNKSNLSYTRLFNANLSSTQLVGTDLRNAILENASLTNADLSNANLTEANLYAAHLVRVSAIGTQLAYANLTKTDWQGADLSESYLDYANLSHANLSATRLTGASLRSTNLENANLRNADLSRADLQGANVAGADFQGTILFVGKQNPADQFVETPDIGSQNASIKGVDFSQAKNLDPQQLAFICTQGGLNSRCP
ncbi:pentapeptide repeat-containing protein [Dolichospermum sp. UHCC 0259]|uniref:pentapeptide repeat-containing protein n=1 Tax=Dolichospermum sp. UHCC 0259 TaxID=2590010 RepID=UPI001444E0B7|nr:pentapeptide repeat-containing protein [Dolichospermum sp. UHCC 0259]MTJ47223.1 low-complexity protein [Dolichospermum sp. UHCC 0259]